ncbi:DNA polymerase III subunit delta [Candidatus Parcubacteria bacterium]|nr:MAG: DNA polymerase III subunit delta [Candidatus Parcubacteria bacterium]
MIIFLYGEDDFRIKRKLSELKEKFKKDVDPSGEAISSIDGEKLSMDELNKAVNSGSLFVRRRMVVVENFFLNKDKEIFKSVLDFLKNEETKDKDPKEGNIIIFHESGIGPHPTKVKKDLWALLGSGSVSQEFKKLSNTEITAWIKKEAESLGANISMPVSAELASVLDNDLWRIKSELEKLINYKEGMKLLAGGKLEITKDDVEAMSVGSFDDNIFALTDAIGSKNKKLALKLFEEQLQNGVSFDYLLTMTIWQFKRLLQVRQALDLGANQRKIISDLKIHPFVAQKSINQVRHYSLEFLKGILRELVEINKKNRESGENSPTKFSILIAQL